MSTNYEMWCLQYNEENNAKLTGWKFLCTNLCSNALFPVRLSPTTTTVHLVSLAIFLLVIFISIVSSVNSLWLKFHQLLMDNFMGCHTLCAIVGIFNNTHLWSFHCHLLLSHCAKLDSILREIKSTWNDVSSLKCFGQLTSQRMQVRDFYYSSSSECVLQ